MKILDNNPRECEWRTFRSSALSFPGAKSPQMELSFPWNFRSMEHSFLGTFAPVELSFIGSVRIPSTFVPWNFRSSGTFVPSERVLHELSLQLSKKQFKAVAIGLHLYILSVLFSGHGVYVLRRLQAERLNAPAKVPWSESSWNIRSCGAKVSRVRKFHRAKVPGLFTPRERMCRGTKSL